MATWVRRKNRLLSWSQCTHCGYKSIDTIFGDKYEPNTCPSCGLLMADPAPPKDDDYDPRRLPIIGRCLKNSRECIRGENCIACGWNETEFLRRIHCPWKTNKDGLRYLDISWS